METAKFKSKNWKLLMRSRRPLKPRQPQRTHEEVAAWERSQAKKRAAEATARRAGKDLDPA